MRPSNKWFPTRLQEAAAWFSNFATQFAAIGAALGFTAPEIAAVQDDNTAMQDLAAGALSIDAFVGAVQEYRDAILEGRVGDPTPTYPADPSTTPSELRPTGVYQRLIELVDRIRAAPTFTVEAGALLGINPASGSSGGPSFPDTDSAKPILKIKTKPTNIIEVRYTKGISDGVDIDIKVDGAADWSFAGRFTSTPAVVTVPNDNGLPHAVQVRARYIKASEPIGLYSDTINVVTTP